MREGMRERSLNRMDEIVQYFSGLHGVLAVAAFGSNAFRERFDDHSDLDFLVLVELEDKNDILGRVSQLDTLCPVDAVQIQYGDAVKLLFSDGVFCDFGIVTPDQLGTFFHGAGGTLWCKEGWNRMDLRANEPPGRAENDLALDTLFHLYIGLLRLARGEFAAAFYEIQVTAAQNLLAMLEGEKADAFSPLRRAETMVSNETLRGIMPGYDRSFEAAEAILTNIPRAEDLPLYKAVKELTANRR